jgi:hypothetical protein
MTDDSKKDRVISMAEFQDNKKILDEDVVDPETILKRALSVPDKQEVIVIVLTEEGHLFFSSTEEPSELIYSAELLKALSLNDVLSEHE